LKYQSWLSEVQTMKSTVEHIVWLDKATLPQEIKRPAYAHEWTEYSHTAEKQTAERIADASLVVTNKVKISAEHIRQAKKLRRIVISATGKDVVDQMACEQYGIEVCNVPAYGAQSVAEHVMSLILSLKRHLKYYGLASVDGTWSRSPIFCVHGPQISDLFGKTMVIIGAGAIGGAVARLASAFGMQVIFAARRGRNPGAGEVAFGHALAMADVLTLHVPLNEDTHHLIGDRQFQVMKRSAILINTARGSLIDAKALAKALIDKRIAGAGIDVLEQEPPDPNHPLLRPEVPNLLLTPHIAWASEAAMNKLCGEVTRSIHQFNNDLETV
jgi:glycerate dehydrogenase